MSFINKLTQFRILLLITLSVSNICFADEVTISGTFDDGAILDGSAGVFSTVSIQEQGIIEDVSITINGIQHSSVGDLIAELRFLGPDGPSEPAFVFHRPNAINGTLGSRSNLDGDYTFSDDENDSSFWSESALPDDETVPTDLVYFQSDENGDPIDLGGPEFFEGVNSAGQWQLVIIDDEDFGNNEGTVEGWTLQFHISAIPEPTSTGMIAITVLLLTRRRR